MPLAGSEAGQRLVQGTEPRTESDGNGGVTKQGGLSSQLSAGNTWEPVGHPWLCYLLNDRLRLGSCRIYESKAPLTAPPNASEQEWII